MARRRTLEKKQNTHNKRNKRNKRNKKIRRTYRRRHMRGGGEPYWANATISFEELANSYNGWNSHLSELFNNTDTAIKEWVTAVKAKNTGAIKGLETTMNSKLEEITSEVIKLPENSKARQNLEWSISQFEAQKNNFKADNFKSDNP